ncbi:MAG: YaaL family protein [Lachnospiraceae bacterium]
MKVLFRQERSDKMPVEEDFTHTTLAEDIEKTRYDLEIAYAGFDNAIDPDMIDCYIYQVNSLLKRYTYLTSLAEKEKVEVANLCPESPIRTLISHVFG